MRDFDNLSFDGLAEAVEMQRPIEAAWRLPLGGELIPRAFNVHCRCVAGRAALCRLARCLSGRAWAGELRIRYGRELLYTGLIEVAVWGQVAPLPAARVRSLWEEEARRIASREAFLSRLRPALEDAGRRRIVQPRDALLIIHLAGAACRGPITRALRDRVPGA